MGISLPSAALSPLPHASSNSVTSPGGTVVVQNLQKLMMGGTRILHGRGPARNHFPPYRTGGQMRVCNRVFRALATITVLAISSSQPSAGIDGTAPPIVVAWGDNPHGQLGYENSPIHL